ncbi:MAG: RNA polymerase sigma factor [Candidatus Latescibacterota bacterium]|nr:MAG: RNA polymerase sigma factor [Candidatus Latescibacterota bacterium]
MKQNHRRSNLTFMEEKRFQTEGDSSLVADSIRGNEKAFRELIERYQPMAFSVIRGVLGDREDAEDVLQNVFIKVYKGLRGFRGDAKFSTWVYRIARNEAVNAARKTVLSGPPADEVDLAAPERSRPDQQYRDKDQREYLERCLGELEENYRVVLELRYMGEMSYQEISDATELPIGTVKTYIHRAKLELKRVMTRRSLAGEHRPE